MTDLERIVRTKNLYNFYGNYTNNLENDTNAILGSIISEFISIYLKEIEDDYSFIIDYDNTVYSLITVRIIRAAAFILRKDIKIKICGKLNSEETKYFDGIKKINPLALKKERNAVIITSFNPIVNVVETSKLSKYFTEIYEPLKRVEPRNLAQMMDFYLNEDSKLYSKSLAIYKDMDMEKFFRISGGQLKDYDKINLDLKKKLCYYKLSGTEEDFGLYEEIVKNKSDTANFYSIPKDKLEFVQTNLGRYVPYCNFPHDDNLISDDVWEEIISETGGDWEIYEYQNYKREEDEE